MLAPHVAAQLRTACAGDASAVAQMMDRLSDAQLCGTSALPDPLPLVPAFAHSAAPPLHDSARRMLLIAAVCVDDRVEVLLQATGMSMPQLLADHAASGLVQVAGRYWFRDQRLRIVVHESADLATRTRTHRMLADLYDARGEGERALWHRALSTMQGDVDLAPRLLAVATRALAAGDAARAYAIAREAASHAGSSSLDAARTLAGRAALSGGWIDDAIAWLAPVVADRDASADAVRLYRTASSLRHGVAPALGERALRGDDAARRFLIGDWSALSSGTDLSTAVALALSGRTAAALDLLCADDAAAHPSEQHAVCEPGPLERAAHAVLVALIRTWQGDLRTGYDVLRTSADVLPVATVFAGLAARLARRLELAMDGRSGDLSGALDAVTPTSPSHDRLMEHAVVAYLAGRSDEAAVHLRLWTEHTGRAPEIAVPGLDEVGPLEFPAEVGPPEAATAHALRMRIRSAGAGAFAHDLESAAEQARSIESPYERGRVEALLGVAFLTRDDRGTAARHLHAASSLFTTAGADAWRCAVDARLSRLGEQLNVDVALPTTPIATIGADPLAVCRAAWEPVLTARELQIAMLIAEGSSNRGIAEALHVSVRTVEVHAGRVFRKFDVRSRGELTALAHRTNRHT